MQTDRTRKLTRAAVVGALYAVLSLLGGVFGISYGPIQFRFSEALCLLPFLFPESAWGLGIGCLVANLLSPYGLLDVLLGSMATLIAALLTARCPNRYLAPVPPMVLNGTLIGGLSAFEQVGFTAAFARVFVLNGGSILLSEGICCYTLGFLLLRRLVRSSGFEAAKK